MYSSHQEKKGGFEMTQFLTRDKIGTITMNSNSISDNTQLVSLLSSMPFHRGVPMDVKNCKSIVAYFCGRRLALSNWINHDDVYWLPNGKGI